MPLIHVYMSSSVTLLRMIMLFILKHCLNVFIVIKIRIYKTLSIYTINTNIRVILLLLEPENLHLIHV